jgi:hypothetical protein
MSEADRSSAKRDTHTSDVNAGSLEERLAFGALETLLVKLFTAGLDGVT